MSGSPSQPDGRILVGVAIKVGESQQWVLTRVTPDGRLDTSFSGDGRLVVSFPGEPRFLFLTAILVQPDDKILAVGFRDDSQLCVARYLPNGSRDRAFGDEGKLQRELPGKKARVSSANFDGTAGCSWPAPPACPTRASTCWWPDSEPTGSRMTRSGSRVRRWSTSVRDPTPGSRCS